MKKHRSFLTLACAAAAAILFLFTGADAKAAGAASLSSALIQGNQVVVTGTCSVSSEDGVLHLYAQAPYESGAQGLEVAQAPNGTATFAFPLNKNTANSNLYKKFTIVAIQNGVPTAVSGVSDAQKHLIASLFEGRIVYLTADALTAKRAAEDIRALSGKKVALLAAKDEVLTYRKAGSRDALFRRLTALHEWQAGAEVLVADIEAAAQLVPKELTCFHLETGAEHDMRRLIDGLVRAGYVREYSPEQRGTFAVRGDVLDVYPVNLEHPVRIDFFGDEVESIKPYDEVTGERYEKLSCVDLVAATDAVASEEEWPRILQTLHAACKKASSSAAYARMQQIVSDLEVSGANDFVLPLLENSSDLFSTLPEGTLLVFDECKLIRDKLVGMYKEHVERFSELEKGGEVMSFSLDQYAPAQRMERFSDFRTVALQTFAGNTYFFEPLKLFNFTSTPARRRLDFIERTYSSTRRLNSSAGRKRAGSTRMMKKPVFSCSPLLGKPTPAPKPAPESSAESASTITARP